MSNRRKSAFEDGKALKLKLEQLIDGHKAAAAYCMTYNNMAAWLHTMSAATTVALSALLQASDANKNAIGITLIVLTAFTTGVSFWQNICRFASRFTDHSTAISRCDLTMQPAMTHTVMPKVFLCLVDSCAGIVVSWQKSMICWHDMHPTRWPSAFRISYMRRNQGHECPLAFRLGLLGICTLVTILAQ